MAQDSPRDMLALVLRSRKALDHTKTLCLHADVLAKESTQLALDVCAVDAKVRWGSEMIMEQIKLVGSVTRALGGQRGKLEQDAKAWDAKRKERISSLDALLDDLGSQLVPPSFYETASGSSLFGSQHSAKRIDPIHDGEPVVAGNPKEGSGGRTKWKSLRFFVDERAIEEAVERMDEDRNSLEDLLESTLTHTQSLTSQISSIQGTLTNPRNSIVPSLQEWLKGQEGELNRMAQLLEDVTNHFGQMENALGDMDAGEVLGDEDMDVLEGDTDELPGIIEETEQSLRNIEEISQKLKQAKENCEVQLAHQKGVLSTLEVLGIEMGELVERHQSVEVEATTIHATLQNHLIALAELQETYVNYRAAYGKLVQEMDRRRKYRAAVEKIIHGMNEQLLAMREEENTHRDNFLKAAGAFLPEDLCPFVADMPTVFEVTSGDNEVAVDIDSQYVTEVRRYIGRENVRLSQSIKFPL